MCHFKGNTLFLENYNIPLELVRKNTSKEKKHVNIAQPKIVQVYNASMGGVDRMDQNAGKYRISIRSKKWWWPLFAFIPDAALCNAWLLYSIQDTTKDA